MPVPGNTVRVGGVWLDALDAEEVADLLGDAALVIGALAGEPAAEAAWAGLAIDERSLTELHIGLAIAAADLDQAIDEHTGTLHA